MNILEENPKAEKKIPSIHKVRVQGVQIIKIAGLKY